MDIKELAIYKRQAVEASKKRKELKITSQVKVVEAQDFRKKLFGAIKLVKAKRDEILNPLKESMKKTKDLFNPIIDELTETDKSVKTEMDRYVFQQQLVIEEKKKEIEQKVEAGEMSFEKAGEKIEKVEEKINVVKTRTDRDIEIYDESQIPREYYNLDRVRVRRDALAGKVIKGVKVVEKTTVVN